MRHRRNSGPAKGTTKPGGMRGCVVYFDEETFATIRQRALDENTSFGEQARQLVEWGLMA